MTTNYSANLSSSLTNTQSLLHNFLNHPQAEHNLLLAFGNDFNTDIGLSLIQSLTTDNLISLVNLEILPTTEINNALGAYSANNNTIYLSTELLNSGDTDTITRVLLEEIGHYLDARGNINDALGDEGAIFASLVLGEELDSNQLALLEAEDNTVTVTIDGQTLDIEQMSIIYVNDDATGINDGSSWVNAYTDLQDALAVAGNGDEIWVAEGIYRPTLRTDREISFVLKDGVALYGGFAGGESERSQRRFEENITILSGDIGTPNNNRDNTYQVVNVSNTNDSTVLDGFQITGGNSDILSRRNGAGIFSNQSSAILANLTIVDNNAPFGGGMFSENSQHQITNVLFLNNSASNGGALANNGDSSTLTDVRFYGNNSGNSGGAIYIRRGNNNTLNNVEFKSNQAGDNGGAIVIEAYSSPNIKNALFLNNNANQGGAISIGGNNVDNKTSTIVNAVFKSNIARNRGGAISTFDRNDNPSFTVLNSLFDGNISLTGAGIYNFDSFSVIGNSTFVNNQSRTGSTITSEGQRDRKLSVTNSIIYNNSTYDNNEQIVNINGASAIVSDSLVEGGYVGDNIITSNPLFINSNNFDFRLSANSPALNQGNNDFIVGFDLDLAGNPRIVEDRVDLGAYEGVAVTPQPTNPQLTDNSQIIYVNAAATGDNNGNSWANAFTDLQDAIGVAEFGSQIWVAKGTYKPSEDDRDASFNLVNAVAIYGGFAGVEQSLEARNFQNNTTILSGDIGITGDISDNSYHVVDASFTTNSTILDGIIITDGNADGIENNSSGGGIYAFQSNTIFRNLTVRNNNANSGGGLYSEESLNQIFNLTFENNNAVDGGAVNLGINSNSLFLNTTFRNNNANNGGAIYNDLESNPTIIETTFVNNSANNGGAIYTNGSGDSRQNTSINVNQSTFRNNNADESGGAIYEVANNSSQYNNNVFYDNFSKIGGAIYNTSRGNVGINNTFVSNKAESGAAIYNLGTPEIYNSVFWNNISTVNNEPIFNNNNANTIVRNSIVEGDYNGLEIIDSDPQFVDLEAGDLRIKSDSPAIDTGINDFVIGDEDIAGLPRIFNNTVDIGAYEYISQVLSINNVVISPKDLEVGADTVDAVFTVTLLDSSGNATSNDTQVTVDYSTVDGSAKAGIDYTPTSGTLTFAPGETEKTITVPVKSDAIEETNKTFSVNLNNASIEAVLNNQGVGTITNSDDPIVDPVINPLDTNINRFQNEDIPGTYLFAGEEESRNIRANFPNFKEEGLAFKVAVEDGDNLEPLYRFQSLDTPGTYLFAGEGERQSINENFSDAFREEGLAFYVYGVGTGMGEEFIRFQNSDRPGTYLFAGKEEAQSIRANFPNFDEEGAAFEVVI